MRFVVRRSTFVVRTKNHDAVRTKNHDAVRTKNHERRTTNVQVTVRS